MAENIFVLSNNEIEISVRAHGAELISLKECANGRQFIWNANPKYWNASSPILFPFVGRLIDAEYRYKGKTYKMPIHGFARNYNFELSEKTSDALWFSLTSNPETKKIYPFDFELKCGYILHGKSVDVCWEVNNKSNETMYYSIGGHPGFVCPETVDRASCFIDFHTTDAKRKFVDDKGFSTERIETVPLEGSCLQLKNEFFANDAIILENNQTQHLTLLSPEKKPYIDVKFDAPLFGVWTPADSDAPFVCIEPWYGRCDKAGYNGTLEHREWTNALAIDASDSYKYTITVL